MFFVKVVDLTADGLLSCSGKPCPRNCQRSFTRMSAGTTRQNVHVDFAASNAVWIPCKTVFLSRS